MSIFSDITSWIAQRNVGAWFGLKWDPAKDQKHQLERQAILDLVRKQQAEADDKTLVERKKRAIEKAAVCRGDMEADIGTVPSIEAIAYWVADRVSQQAIIDQEILLINEGKGRLDSTIFLAQREAGPLAWALASKPDQTAAARMAGDRVETRVIELYQTKYADVDFYRESLSDYAQRQVGILNTIIELRDAARADPNLTRSQA
jgi:hypothetical protein